MEVTAGTATASTANGATQRRKEVQRTAMARNGDGVSAEHDSTRAAGIAANPIMRADPVKSNVSLQDKIGGSVSFSNTRVQVAKV